MKKTKQKYFPALHLPKMLQSQKMRMGLLGIIMIPLMYSYIYLWAFFDPYEHIKDLPVAVVNEDVGGTVDGKRFNAGEELVEQLRDNEDAKWEFVTRSQLEEGFKRNRYYLGIVIPDDFSRQAASVTDEEPEVATLQYYGNEGYNYISTQIGARVVSELEISLEHELSRMYAEGIFKELKASAKELGKAADGAVQLHSGTERLHEGLEKLQTGLAKANQGALQLQSGAERLHRGLSKAESAVSSVDKKIDQEVKPKLPEIEEKIESTREVITLLQERSQEIEKIMDVLDQAIEQNKRQEEALNSFLKEHPDLAEDPHLQELEVSIGGEAKTLAQLREEWHSHRTFIEESLQKFEGFLDNLDEMKEQLKQIELAIGKLDQVKELKHGLDELNNGAQILASKLGEMQQGLAQLTGGSDKLVEGAQKLEIGSGELKTGLKDGVKKADDNLKGSDAKSDMISNPVNVEEDPVNPVPNYATGFTPYFLSLSLWVGAMLLFTVIDIHRPAIENFHPLSWGVGALVGFFQAVIVTSALLFGLGIEAKLVIPLYGLTILMAFTFIAINQTLVLYFNDMGRLIAIFILMLQLTSSAGTYPAELLPPLFQWVHPLIPMTYSVEGLRSAISIGDMSMVMHSVRILCGYLAVAIVLMSVGRVMKARDKANRWKLFVGLFK
ncbi:YhgE/Pip domain-containing protein [Mechercharimyces sp. CAU 1602]|uniref:YhgE/Pip domain-containing protein n=1 Tax=Mechercharimyces sp. CAU 1602 TaxID=2973933 RepID=UPI002161A5A7|nr:YhgE/Pip domain-containing protein [Mechercharimyces sp. CAU 1602]MCS1352720.1 YhgE/Pip domain-containing protein [Mechercharimyces sp. CAU 1602]